MVAGSLPGLRHVLAYVNRGIRLGTVVVYLPRVRLDSPTPVATVCSVDAH